VLTEKKLSDGAENNTAAASVGSIINLKHYYKHVSLESRGQNTLRLPTSKSRGRLPIDSMIDTHMGQV